MTSPLAKYAQSGCGKGKRRHTQFIFCLPKVLPLTGGFDPSGEVELAAAVGPASSLRLTLSIDSDIDVEAAEAAEAADLLGDIFLKGEASV